MGDSTHTEGRTDDTRVPPNGVKFESRLVFFRENRHGAKLYFDSMNNCAVKIEDIETPFEPDIMVNFQGDQYMGKNGAKYLLTPHFEDMDSTRRIFHTRADSEPPLAKPGADAEPKKEKPKLGAKCTANAGIGGKL